MSSPKENPSGLGFIYRLVDPRNDAIHYIGLTKYSLEHRLKQHLKDPTNPGMGLWFRLLAVEQLKPRIEEILTAPFADLPAAERAQIEMHRSSHPLLNDKMYLRNTARILGFSPSAPASPQTELLIDAPPLTAPPVAVPSRRARYREYLVDLAVRRHQAQTAALAMERKRRQEVHRVNDTSFSNQRDYDQAAAAVEAIGQAALEAWADFYRLGRVRKRLKRMARRPRWWQSMRRQARHTVRSFSPQPQLREPVLPVLERKHDAPQTPGFSYHSPATFVETVVNPFDSDYLAMLWQTCVGLVAVVYLPKSDRRDQFAGPWTMQWLQEEGRDPAAVIVLPSSTYPDGEKARFAEVVDPESPTDSYRVKLDRVYELLHRRLPWWPPELRTRERILAWRPDQPIQLGRAEHRWNAALIRTIDSLPAGSSARTVLEYIHWRQDRSVNQMAANELLRFHEQHLDWHLNTAIKHDWKHDGTLPRPDRAIEEAAWREILARTDDDTLECATAAWLIHGGDRFHLGTMKDFKPPLTGVVAEWFGRLEPAAEPTAAHRYLVNARHRDSPEHFRVDYFTDPVTGIAAVCEYGYDSDKPDNYCTWAPKQLDTKEELSELILDETAWVRTEDGTLYIAPQPVEERSCTWGYSGGGPTNLTNLIVGLLDDIGARPSEDLSSFTRRLPRRLEEFTEQRWPNGTVVARSELERMVSGEGYWNAR